MNILRTAATELVSQAIESGSEFYPEHKEELIEMTLAEMKNGEDVDKLTLYGLQYDIVERIGERFGANLKASGLTHGDEFQDRLGNNRAVVVGCMSGKKFKVALFDDKMIYSHKSADTVQEIAAYLIDSDVIYVAKEKRFEVLTESPEFLERTAKFSDSSKKKIQCGF
jgi:hypothetical protein